MSRRRFWLLLLLLIGFAPAVCEAEQPQRVLLLHSFGPNFSPFNSFASTFRADLVGRSPRPIDIYEASLESARFAADQPNDPFVDYLTALVAARPPDLVVAIGGAAGRFAQTHRERLFPSTPMLFTALSDRLLKSDTLTQNDAVAAIQLDLPAAIENILRLRPQTTNVLLVVGNSPLEQFWRRESETLLQPFRNRVAFEWTQAMSFDQIVERAATLPPSWAILYGLMAVDAEGVPHEEDRAIIKLHDVASVPLFGLFANQLGKGIVGGPLVSVDDSASDAADLSLSMLAGGAPGDLTLPARGPGAPLFDDRELDRWGISESLLPPGSTMRFREPSLYEQYRWQVLGALALVMVESGLILALLENRRRLTRTKSALSLSEERLSTAATAADLGLWVWDVVRDEIWVSESGRKLFGLAGPERITLERLVRAVHPDDRKPFQRAIDAAIAGQGDFEMEFRLAVRDHGLRWVATRGRMEFDSTGQPSRMRGVAIDVTGRQTAEEEARELSGRLIRVHEDERSRLARELHDDVTQRLAVLAINAGHGERIAKDSSESAVMHEMREELARLSEDVHSLSHRLHPSILDDLGLEEALRAECDRFVAIDALDVEFEADGVPANVSSETALCLFRIAQEALRNVSRHAGASRVRLSLTRENDELHLLVEDNGRGFDPRRASGKASLGLVSMRQRASLVAGRIEIKGTEGGGTTVSASVPLEGKDHDSSTRIAG